MERPNDLILRRAADGKPAQNICPEDIAMWAHCESGLSTGAMIAWLANELDLLDAIDPDCSK